MIDILLKLGLSDKEAKVYLAALKLGSAPASKIAQMAGLNRPTTYVILEKLAPMGLITIFDKGKIRFYTAENPEQLFKMAENEQRSLEDMVKELKDKLPEFKALYSRNDRPRVLLYDATEHADDYLYSRLKTGEKIYAFTDFDTYHRSDPLHQETSLRIKKNIPTIVIYTRDDGPVEDASSKKELRTAKFIARKDFPLKTIMTVAPDSGILYLSDPSSKTAVFIENKLIAQSFKAIFDLLWQKI